MLSVWIWNDCFSDEDIDGILKMSKNFYELQKISFNFMPQKLPARNSSSPEENGDEMSNREMANIPVPPSEPPITVRSTQ